jgi:hypothetical protein
VPYLTEDGKRVPSVTTVIGRFKHADMLIRWAVKETREGRNYEETRDAAAHAGTIAHTLVECAIAGHPEPDFSKADPATLAKARRAFTGYMGWQRAVGAEIRWSERRLVSAKLRVGGTPDAGGIIAGQRALIDWKTSNAIYPDHLIQLAAYAMMIEEADGEAPDVHYICRFDKQTGDFSFHQFTDLSAAKRQFILLREAYDLDQLLKKQAR